MKEEDKEAENVVEQQQLQHDKIVENFLETTHLFSFFPRNNKNEIKIFREKHRGHKDK